MNASRLIVIGAGPKAMALASKNQVLASLGFAVPVLHVIEKRSVAANWTGEFGYTNGRMPLGTAPEKDVGFPYRAEGWGESANAAVNRRMASFSWGSFLVDTGAYSDWVDRGRPQPEHRHWARYLQWVAERVSDSAHIHQGEVVGIEPRSEDGCWRVRVQGANGASHELEGEGIVVTGPGCVRVPDELPVHDRLLTVESFWKRYLQFRERRGLAIAIIGAGENAASIALVLHESGASPHKIDIVCPTGMTFSRGESFRENRVYSDPNAGEWGALSVPHRRDFISRTDRGVFSQSAQRLLDHAENVSLVSGRLTSVIPAAGGGLALDIRYEERRKRREYDFVILATGADQLSFFRGLLAERDQARLARAAGLSGWRQDEVEARIGEDLAVEGLTPKLHLPMLSGLRQGPGFANLSCLGRFSDRVLKSYAGAHA